ncbi:outer membrane beta-barrel protein [Chryseobacterium sp. C-71]|uniref:outer membrane beta-barrel protein n=1 Tax=Chryseobacterium sp. C-71 TaxID=2893882 RepID=UPI001E470865|nr:outer membrane beta-barrel protein [Chryseobacterium sp. C-71]UFH31755.1 outer membrane beta-barrel protein [Chryseobacterium sp. C-71]
MFYQKFFFIFTLLFLQFIQAQKTKVDTVYVYEKVIVYDTIYFEKAVKSKFQDISLTLPILNEFSIKKRIFKVEEEKEIKKNSFLATFQYGIEAGIGLKKSTWAKELSSDKQQFGENLGIWISKSVSQNLYLMLSANVYHWNSTFDFDANKEDTYLNGFYFTQDSQPLLFQRFNNKHFEYTAQLKVLYEWKKFRPCIGFALNKNSYKMQFLVPENKVLNKLDDFKSSNFNLGFSFGLQYRILPKILITADYQQYSLENLSLKNSSFDFDIFKTSNTFAERKLTLGISYVISK